MAKYGKNNYFDGVVLPEPKEEALRRMAKGVDASKGYLESTDAGLLFDGPRSMECFFNLRQSDGTQRPAQFSTSMIAIAVTPMDAIMFHCGNKSLQVSRVTIGDDIHAVISYDGATAMCYINGIKVGAMQPTAYMLSALFRIGDPSHITKSPIHFCRHFNYALSAEEVAAHYNDGDPAGYILPQNLKNIKDMAFTSKTFEFDMDSPYYWRILESSELESGRRYRVDYVVEEWDIAPYVMVTCGISCGVKAVAGNQYWNNLSAAKLGENQYVVVDTKKNRHSVYVCLRIGPCIPTYFPPVESNGSLCQDARLHRRVPAAEPNTYRRRFRCPVARLGAPASRSEWHPPAAGCFGRRV